MKTINIFDRAGAFAENKDVAREIRIAHIIPALERDEDVTLDFKHVDTVTQSFIHALISGVLRKFGPDILDHVAFRDCTENIKKIIGIVLDYTQEGMD